MKPIANAATLTAEGLDAIAGLVGSRAVKTADAIVDGVAAILEALAKMQTGELTADEVRAKIAELHRQRDAGDAAADAIADSRPS
jgi:hypothetical protein